jgi:hypothetical protein
LLLQSGPAFAQGFGAAGLQFIFFDRASQLEFVHSAQSLPTNIFAAVLSGLNCHRSQFDATFAYSPPPG